MKATPFLMFQGQAQGALALYRSAFPDLEELLLQEHAEGPQAGQIAMAQVRFAGQEVMLFDSPPVHDFTFTPSSSIFLTMDVPDAVDPLARAFEAGGKFLMPPDDYGFSRRFAWVQDRFGVSWQINCR